jgi:RNA polymerase sigma-70 factor (ECF subfamily)
MQDNQHQALEREETRTEVRDAIARLPGRQRQALVLKQYQDLSYSEIAEVMGITSLAVQMLLHRAMTALRRDLAPGRTN